MAPPVLERNDPQLFNEAFDQIREGIDQAVDKFNEIVDNVNKWRWLLGAAVLWWIKERLEEVRAALELIMEKVRYAIEHQMPVLSLMLVSFRWVDEIKTPASDLAYRALEPADENIVKWTGDAATAYNNKAAKQKAALDETVVKAEFISQWLFKIAKANVDFALKLADLVSEVAGDLAQAAVDATTVIDIPWAIDALADSIGRIVTAGIDQLIDIGRRFVDALGNVRDIATQVGDHTKLPGGKWPEAVYG